MKRLFILFVASVLSSVASAQMRATTKQECNRRCIDRAEQFVPWTKHQENLKQIRDKKKSETDAVKLKQLATDEESEMDRFTTEHEKLCRSICKDNPEE
jgi:hypothetical protein